MLAGYGAAELVGVAVQIATDVFAAGGIPVREALRVGDGRYYSFTCPDPDCCPSMAHRSTRPAPSSRRPRRSPAWWRSATATSCWPS